MTFKTLNILEKKEISIKRYYDNRNKVLIVRDTGGLGDIFMMRMIFEDFKTIMPDAIIVAATPPKYHDALRNHPFIDEIVDSNTINLKDYIISYNISAACGKYEKKIAPLADKHRSDIWAEHCGVKLNNHNMHFTARKDYFNKKTIVFSPKSAIASKNLIPSQIEGVIKGVKEKGHEIVCLHDKPINCDVETICANNIQEYLNIINSAEYIITVDSACFHAAGGLDKPMVGIFSWVCGKTYGKYYNNWKLVQRHRDNGNWPCGPCYHWYNCPLERLKISKPCITTIKPQEILDAFDSLKEHDKALSAA